ncbi:SpvB/TcaC N-terminal domain-containing protein [Accumulibacter sp.]|uniref:SpvB/TcaC N-terminal domain-containing protein n=1 Tax=Accumulibacter sp. TaxID=2053492 RepID=UPI0028C40502|nr:SpvB/TcaC N-terminal domain-containing protein [Accumulibacter sp.]
MSKEPPTRQAPAGGGEQPPAFALSPPQLSLPKGGGAIRGIGEKFSANPVTGTGSMSIPIALSPGRAGFGPQLTLSYDSGAGNGVFGLGWNLSQPGIRRKTEKGLPTYDDNVEADTFQLSGAEDLIPELELSAPNGLPRRVVEDVRWARKRYRVHHYRPRIEGLFARIERWCEIGKPANAFWRTVSRDNITSWYGRNAESRIVDPADPRRIFEWLLCQTNDDKGNVATYGYSADTPPKLSTKNLWESNRQPAARTTNRYLKRIRYGNATPYLPSLVPDRADRLPTQWLFEALFDYGDYPAHLSQPAPPGSPSRNHWLDRSDASSTYRAGFEIRTYRLCRRVLMFHHFPGEPGVSNNCLVRATEFDYAFAGQFNAPEQAGYATLRGVTHRSYQRKPGSTTAYESRALPPVSFTYSEPRVDPNIHTIATVQLDSLPVGTQGPGYRWLDLDGEGLPGVLAEGQGAWYYKPNLGDGTFGPMRTALSQPSLALAAGSSHQFIDLAGDGSIDVVEFGGPAPGFQQRDSARGWKRHVPFASLPNIDWQDPNLRFVDLTGDGHADALITEQEVFTWYPSLSEEGFGSARQSRQAADDDSGPRLLFADGTQTIFLADMCGDGLTDLVRIRNGDVCYWPNQGYGRFGRKVTLGNAPRFDAPDLFDPDRIRLTDIDGSGPVDIIYLGRSGAQLYFNRSGNSLSEPLTVSLPVATHNLAAVQVADLLGNGTACLVWNSHLPADASRPVCYIDLMAGRRANGAEVQAHRHHEKPHLLIRVDNHLGASTDIEYTPSTRFYLQDQQAGTPWVTRLPFPVHCVSKVTVRDAWRKTEFSSSYSYHHGYFDGEEREFRGFGRVDQVDTQAFTEAAVANTASSFFTQDDTLFQAPIKTTTWFHTGVADDRNHILSLFAREYLPARHRQAFANAGFAEPALPQPELDPGKGPALTGDEWREAMRACKGMPLRQEVVELDAKTLEESGQHKPVRLFSATQHNCHLRRVQPRGANRHAVFLALQSESYTCHYELDLTAPRLTIDPRIAHTLNLKFDEWGNTLQSVAVVYPRRALFANTRLSPQQLEVIRAVQAERHIAYTEARFTAALAPAWRHRHHRLPVPCEVRTYELSSDDAAGFAPRAGPYFTVAEFLEFELSDRLPDQGGKPVAPLAYHEQPRSRGAHKRLVEHVRTLYWDDGSDTVAPSQHLAFGEHGPRGLKYEDYKLALTEDLLAAVFGTGSATTPPTDKLAWEAVPAAYGQASKTCRDLLNASSTSGYVPGTVIGLPASEYWMRSGRAGFEPDAHLHFFMPERYTDAFGNSTTLQYDWRDLYVQSSSDARGNKVAVERFDHRVLAPTRMRDANGNCSEVAFDVHGLPVASAVLGKVTQSTTGIEVTETGDTVASLSFANLNPTPQAVSELFLQTEFNGSQARTWLEKATARFLYHFGDERDARGNVVRWGITPAGACSVLRERHERDLANIPANSIPLQIALEYSDGTGQAFVTKVQAEPEAPGGPLRWLTNGKIIVNNKGKPVLQFEPYFSPSGHRFTEPQAVGVSPVMFYDAPGRLMRTDMPDGTFSRVEFSPWFSRSFDANDTVLDSRWYRERGSPNPATPLDRDLAGKLLDSDDFRAAWLAARHADTPAETHFDSLGREVVAIAHNRSPNPARRPAIEWSVSDWEWQDDFSLTFTKLDAEGKPLWIRDARGNLVMQYISPTKPTRWADAANEDLPASSVPCYDIAGNLLYQHSMDAGDRWMLMDAAGKPMLAWDFNDRGEGTAMQARLYRSDYDALHRPTSQWLKIDAAAPALVEAFAYCDTTAPRDAAGPLMLDKAQGRNLIGQVVTHVDPSGVATVERISLQGQPAHVTRRLILPQADGSASLVDWNTGNRSSLLEQETFHHITEFDARGRMTRLYNWHRNITFAANGSPQDTPGHTNRVAVIEPRYNERGALQREWMHVRACKATSTDGAVSFTADPTRSAEAIKHIAYNAKGQKLSLDLANGTQTRYSYDAKTFRLTQLFTRRPATAFRDDCASSARPLRPCGVQNLHYTYDPVGNITHIQDDAQQTVYFRNSRVEPSCNYTYDALYRLIEATGREHDVRTPPPLREGPWRSGSFPSGDQLRNYTQRYRYDVVGNFIDMAHTADGGGWTRKYSTQPDSNRLHQTWTGNSTEEAVTYRHDAHGSMLNLNRLDIDAPPPIREDENWGRQIQWDWRDMIRGFDLGGGGLARYHYCIDKQRTRKHITRSASADDSFVEDRIYLGDYELYRRRNPQGGVVAEIESLHLFEGEQRVLLVDDVIAADNPRPDRLQVKAQTLFRYQYGNHLGSVGLELDNAAQLISYEEFHPYGTSSYRLMEASQEAPAKRYRYTGMERDEESGLACHGARQYSTRNGVWLQADPIGVSNRINVFDYSGRNPVGRLDQLGTEDTEGEFASLKRTAAAVDKKGLGIGERRPSGTKTEVLLERPDPRVEPPPADPRNEADKGASRARTAANSKRQNPAVADSRGRLVQLGKPKPGDEMSHMYPARNVGNSGIPNDIVNAKANIPAAPARDKTALIDGHATDVHAATEPKLDEIAARNLKGKQPLTAASSAAAQRALAEAKITLEPMTRKYSDQIKAGGLARPEPGPKVNPKTGVVVRPVGRFEVHGFFAADVMQLVSSAHTVAILSTAIRLGSKDPERLSKGEMAVMNMAGYVLEGNVFAPYGAAWRNTWTDSFVDQLIKVNGPEWIVPGYTIDSQDNYNLLGRMNGLGYQ